MNGTVLQATPKGWCGRFQAMASPCELLVEGVGRSSAQALLALAAQEAQRIEHKFSRYREKSVVSRLNTAAGAVVAVDDETATLLDFAAQCHAFSEGLFDITTGVLRRAWRFEPGAALPTEAQVSALLPLVGWQRVRWQRPQRQLQLPAGMEVDFGGIGKEYAVDRTLALLRAQAEVPMLLNFGGDLAASGPRSDGGAWQVGIEEAGMAAPGNAAAAVLALRGGGLATSGDARRHLLKDGTRYGHVLDPRSGWPVQDPPLSVTVAAPSCTEAGLLSTLALLQGRGAEAWLQAQGMPHWVQR